IDNAPALTTTDPALPVLLGNACDVICDILSMTSCPATATEMLPPLPNPDVPPDINPLLTIDNAPAMTATDPALPVLPGNACDVMPVTKTGFCDVPWMTSCPATLTETLPPRPDPDVLLEITPLFSINKLPALTMTVPAFPEFLLDTRND